MTDTTASPNNLLVAYRGRPQRERAKTMPWTGPEFKARHNKKLTGGEADKAAAQASAILASGAPEGVAIATANKRVNKMRKRGVISNKAAARHFGQDEVQDVDASSR